MPHNHEGGRGKVAPLGRGSDPLIWGEEIRELFFGLLLVAFAAVGVVQVFLYDRLTAQILIYLNYIFALVDLIILRYSSMLR